MEKETIDLYSPFNAKNLTEEQLAAMEHFTKADLKQLDEAYPNSATTAPYLILKERGVDEKKQVYHPSTWHNFYALVRMGNTRYYPISFKSIFKRNTQLTRTAPVQVAKDLTDEEVKAELKKQQGATQTAKEDDKVKVDAGTGNPKSAAQIAKEEGSGIDGGEPVKEKPLSKMNVAELTVKFKEVLGEEPEAGSTKGQMIAAIEKKK